MIYPTRTAVIATAAGAPVALVLAALAPAYWFAALAWPLSLILLLGFDALLANSPAAVQIHLPEFAYVGETRDARASISVRSGARQAFIVLDTPPLVAAAGGSSAVPLHEGQATTALPLEMLRRGLARFDQVWVRWTGPLGLAWNQRRFPVDKAFPIIPDLRPTEDHGARLFDRHSFEGMMVQTARGGGSEFDALVEYRTGMDRRSIDWKQSARHMKLHAKQYRTERNNQIVFALDCGRQMCEPVAGLPRIDRVTAAMLLTGWVALKLGDRVALEAFDSRPRLSSGFVSGARGFPELQRVAAGIDYSSDETNYTFALSTLAGRLTRRSMVVLFTEFTDEVSASFLIRAARRLLEKHLLVVVVLRDEELEEIVEAEPAEIQDVTKAITAASLLNERETVISELRHLGIHVVESEYAKVNERLVQAYLQLKKRDLL